MKISLRQLPDKGLDWDGIVTAEDLDLPKELFDCLSPLSVRAAFQRAGDEVIGSFEVKGKYRLTCCRCVEDFERERTDRFEVFFDVGPTDEVIDFRDDLRQELILAASVISLCREDCQGLCPHCGMDLNQGKCNCKRDSGLGARDS